MTVHDHVCRWSNVLLWRPPSAYATESLGATDIPYRRCDCGKTVWGTEVNSPEVLTRLAVPAAAETR